MTPKENLPAKVGTEAPSWLVDAAQTTDSAVMDRVKKYRRLGRLRVVQGSTPAAKARVKEFGDGSVITVPGNTMVAAAGVAFEIVPLFMFTEFCKWKDRDDDGDRPMILDRSFDEISDVAMRARDKNRRREKYGDDDRFEARYVEHLCFPSIIYGEHPLAGTPVTVSFEKGEFITGSNFCTAISMRKVGEASAPLWSQVWTLKSAEHSSPQYTWWGFDFGVPDWDDEKFERRGGAYILDGESGGHRELASGLEAKYNEQALVVDRSDADEDAVIDHDEEM